MLVPPRRLLVRLPTHQTDGPASPCPHRLERLDLLGFPPSHVSLLALRQHLLTLPRRVFWERLPFTIEHSTAKFSIRSKTLSMSLKSGTFGVKKRRDPLQQRVPQNPKYCPARHCAVRRADPLGLDMRTSGPLSTLDHLSTNGRPAMQMVRYAPPLGRV